MLRTWVNEKKRDNVDFQFEVFDITEKQALGNDIIDFLSENLIKNFVPIDVLKTRFQNRCEEELEQYIEKQLFAPEDNQLEKNVRQGDWGEALTTLIATDLRGLDLPTFKLRYKTNKKKSMLGLDVLAVVSDSNANFNKVVLFESKTRITYKKQIAIEAYNSLRYDCENALIDMINFLSKRCYERGDYQTAQRFDDLALISDSVNKEYHAVIIIEKKLWNEEILKELDQQLFDFNNTYMNIFLISNLKVLIANVYKNTFKVAKRIVYEK